jgi:hypothetical protein
LLVRAFQSENISREIETSDLPTSAARQRSTPACQSNFGAVSMGRAWRSHSRSACFGNEWAVAVFRSENKIKDAECGRLDLPTSTSMPS